MSDITIREVALQAGVSDMTVSRVLRNSGYVSTKTRERVLKVAGELGYVRNQVAGALASRRTNLVGIIVPSLTNSVYADVLNGIAQELAGSPLQPVFGVTNYDPKTEEGLLEDLISWRPAGLAVAGLKHTRRARALMQSADIPIVEMMDVDGRAVQYNVGMSHREIGRLSADFLVTSGYESVGYIAYNHQQDIAARKRYEGFISTLKDAGIQLVGSAIASEESSARLGRQLTADLLRRYPTIQAIYYANDDMALGGLMHCFANEIDVPDTLAIIGYSGFSINDSLPKELTTVNSPRSEVGHHSARYLLEVSLGKRNIEHGRLVMPVSLNRGETA